VIEPTISVSESDVADINKAIDLMIRNTNRMGKDAVHRAGYRFLVSGKANTPKADGKNRTLHTANDAGAETWQRKSKGVVMTRSSRASKFYIVRRQEGKPMRILMPNPDYIRGKGSGKKKREAREISNKLKNKYKTKPHIGAAKDSWNRAFNDLGRSATRLMARRSRRVRSASVARRIGGTFNPAVNIQNTLSYLRKIAPELEGIAMRKAGASLLHDVELGIEKQVRKF
jgi:hypothetical protein